MSGVWVEAKVNGFVVRTNDFGSTRTVSTHRTEKDAWAGVCRYMAAFNMVLEEETPTFPVVKALTRLIRREEQKKAQEGPLRMKRTTTEGRSSL